MHTHTEICVPKYGWLTSHEHTTSRSVSLYINSLSVKWGLSIFSQLMLIAFNRWKCNKTTPTLFSDILLPVLPNVWSVQRIHLKKGSHKCVLSLGISINIKWKKKNKRMVRTQSFVKITWGCSVSVWYWVFSIRWALIRLIRNRISKGKHYNYMDFFKKNDLTLKYFSPHRLYRVISVSWSTFWEILI